MEKCRRMKRPQCTSKSWIYSWLWKSSRTRQQYYRLESFAIKTGTHTNGSMVKNHISWKTGFGYNVTRRTSFRSWFQACQVLHPVLILYPQWHQQDRRAIILHLPQSRLLHQLNYNSTKRQWDSRQRGSKWNWFPSSACVKFKCWRDDREGRPVVCCQSW